MISGILLAIVIFPIAFCAGVAMVVAWPITLAVLLAWVFGVF